MDVKRGCAVERNNQKGSLAQFARLQVDPRICGRCTNPLLQNVRILHAAVHVIYKEDEWPWPLGQVRVASAAWGGATV